MATAPKAEEPANLADCRPVTGQRAPRRLDCQRQRIFLTVLAETGCISEACQHAGVLSRSSYRRRQRGDAAAFADAWDQALRRPTLRLTTIAFERAVKGTEREFWSEGERVAETRSPSDKLLMFLLQPLLPRRATRARNGDAPLLASARFRDTGVTFVTPGGEASGATTDASGPQLPQHSRGRVRPRPRGDSANWMDRGKGCRI